MGELLYSIYGELFLSLIHLSLAVTDEVVELRSQGAGGIDQFTLFVLVGYYE